MNAQNFFFSSSCKEDTRSQLRCLSVGAFPSPIDTKIPQPQPRMLHTFEVGDCLFCVQIGEPLPSQLSQLRCLWKEAFGDSDVFLDTFYNTAFSTQRCRCVIIDGTVAAALYWFDCIFQEKPVAYIYAVATAIAYRKKGLCHILMQNTHQYLADAGYIGAVLVPGSADLFQFYEGIGYQTCCYMDEISYDRKTDNTLNAETLDSEKTTDCDFKLHLLRKEEYSHLRRKFLPKNAIIQENENLDFLETQAQFYLGKNFLFTASKQGDVLHCLELLGDTSAIPKILEILECTRGTFRIPGKEKEFAMYVPLQKDTEIPKYFGFAFD